ncbi:MAG: Gfo/Idh/MocA family oxidoreductase [Clostridia bacterium]|nr:Gfo/Idh/MocA family oxidoreductase [Clostridia bacterium]
MRKIKTVQIGVGHDHARQNFTALNAMPHLFEIVGLVRVPGEEEIKPEFLENTPHIPTLSLEEAFAVPGLEAAVIETTDMELVKYAQMAADRDLHVFMDKPGSQSAEQYEEMLRTVHARKKVFGIGYVLRFNPMIRSTLELARQGKLGELYAVEAHMSRDDKDEKRRWLEQFQGGMTYFLGCHLIDQVYAFMGVPEEIIPLNASTTPEKNNALDLGMVAFRYPKGMSFIKACGAEPGGFVRRQMVICGSQGTVEIRPLEEKTENDRVSRCLSWFRTDPDTPLAWGTPGEKATSAPFNRYEGMFGEFAERILKNRPSTAEELEREARLHRMILAACGMACDYKGSIDI